MADKMIARPFPLPSVREVCRGGMLLCRAFFLFAAAVLCTALRAIDRLPLYLTPAEMENLGVLSSLLLLWGMTGLCSGFLGLAMEGPPCTRRVCASVTLLVATLSVFVSGDLLVLACAAWGARLGREASVAVYVVTGAVGGAGALLGFMAIVWGEDS